MKQHAHLVQTGTGSLIRKAIADMGPEDALVFDGPDAFARANAFQAWAEAQIEAAGGLELWKAKVSLEGLPTPSEDELRSFASDASDLARKVRPQRT
jgi:hypothetical protein